MRSNKVEFPGAQANRLAGVIELPEQGAPRAFAVFAHCFTCGKNSLAATRVSRALAAGQEQGQAGRGQKGSFHGRDCEAFNHGRDSQQQQQDR